MASKSKSQAEVFDEIAFAAFSTHFRTVHAARLTDETAHDAARQHWNDNLPGVATLWHGLLKGALVNVGTAQARGLLPPLSSLVAPGPLPGLGAAPDTGPAALARRLGASFANGKARPGASADPGAPEAARDTVPGLAIGRDTEQDE